MEEEGQVELPPLGRLPGLTSWEFVHLIMWSLSSPASIGCHLCVSPDNVFSLGGVGLASSFIPFAVKEEAG